MGMDSAIMYESRITELDEQQGAYTELKAARDYCEHMHGIRTDSMLELSYEARKRIHNLQVLYLGGAAGPHRG